MINKDKIFKIFTDFDGTITTKDVGEAMFLKFGDYNAAKIIINDWIDEKINSVTQWRSLCNTIKKFDINEYDNFLNSFVIDQSFYRLIEFSKNNDIDMVILSDGFNYYINKILSSAGLNKLKIFSNKLSFGENNQLIPNFPYTDEECSRCANCKRNHIINNSGDGDYTIYIGDGFSDTCPAQYCDFIFAKNSLLKYCEVNRISYFPFNDFDDVINKIEQLMKKKRLKKRMQAQLKRKEFYMLG